MKGLITILFLVSTLPDAVQTQQDTTYRVELTATACPLISFFRYERYPGSPNNTTLGFGIFLRGMWHPGRKLAIGLMTGYTVFAEDEFNVNGVLTHESSYNASARLAAIPIQAVISMRGGAIEVGIGMGPYLMLTTINYGTTTHGYRLELGLTFFGSYLYPISNHIHIGAELRTLYLSYRGIISMMPSITLRLEALSY